MSISQFATGVGLAWLVGAAEPAASTVSGTKVAAQEVPEPQYTPAESDPPAAAEESGRFGEASENRLGVLLPATALGCGGNTGGPDLITWGTTRDKVTAEVDPSCALLGCASIGALLPLGVLLGYAMARRQQSGRRDSANPRALQQSDPARRRQPDSEESRRRYFLDAQQAAHRQADEVWACLDPANFSNATAGPLMSLPEMNYFSPLSYPGDADVHTINWHGLVQDPQHEPDRLKTAVQAILRREAEGYHERERGGRLQPPVVRRLVQLYRYLSRLPEMTRQEKIWSPGPWEDIVFIVDLIRESSDEGFKSILIASGLTENWSARSVAERAQADACCREAMSSAHTIELVMAAEELLVRIDHTPREQRDQLRHQHVERLFRNFIDTHRPARTPLDAPSRPAERQDAAEFLRILSCRTAVPSEHEPTVGYYLLGLKEALAEVRLDGLLTAVFLFQNLLSSHPRYLFRESYHGSDRNDSYWFNDYGRDRVCDLLALTILDSGSDWDPHLRAVAEAYLQNQDVDMIRDHIQRALSELFRKRLYAYGRTYMSA